MEYIKSISKKSFVFLLLFVIATVFKSYYINNGDVLENVVVVIIIHTFLLLFYLSLLRKPNRTIIFFIFMAMVIDVSLSLDPMSIVAVFFLCIYRTVFVLQIWQSKKIKFNKKTIKKEYVKYLLVLMFSVEFIFIYIYSNDSHYFILSIVFETILFVLLFLAFMQFLKTPKHGNFEFFIAIAFFLVSDVVFGGHRLIKTDNYYLVLEHVFYSVSYLLIIISDAKIKKNELT